MRGAGLRHDARRRGGAGVRRGRERRGARAGVSGRAGCGRAHLWHAFVQRARAGVDHTRRALRGGAGQAPVPGLRRAGARGGALRGARPHNRRPQLAHAALSAGGGRAGPRPLAKGGGFGARLRRPQAARAQCAQPRHAARDLPWHAHAVSAAGPGLFDGQSPHAAGRRDGPGQDGAGAGDAVRAPRVPGRGDTAAAPGAQLGARDSQLCRPAGGRARAYGARAQALRAARGRHIHSALPAAARLEAGAAPAGRAGGGVRRGAGAAPRGHGEVFGGHTRRRGLRGGAAIRWPTPRSWARTSGRRG